MGIEKVIKQLESILAHVCSMAASPDADEIWKEDSDALEFAITALRSMQEAGEPLSLEQLKQMDGKPVWVVCLKKVKYIDPPIGWRILEKSISGSFGVWNGENCLSQRSYGSDWLAYSYPPAHIDRSKWTAEWVNRMPILGAGDLETRCNSCGNLVLYETDFCPYCGKAMTEEAWAELERRLRG